MIPLQYAIREEDEKEYELEAMCRRHRYEKIIKYTPYCGHEDGDCVYRADKPSEKEGMYRCMMLEKYIYN